MVSVDIFGIPKYGDDTNNVYEEVEDLDIHFTYETFHLEFDCVQQIMYISSKDGELIISPMARNLIRIESTEIGS
jgi:hypothetical protein